MLGNNTYKIIATNLVKDILSRGGELACKKSSIKQEKEPPYQYIVEYAFFGNVDDAIAHYIDVAGAFDVIGQATKWFREHRG